MANLVPLGPTTSPAAGGYLGGAYREGWARILGCLAAVTGGQS